MHLTRSCRGVEHSRAVDFVTFWYDVFRESTVAILACFGRAGDAVAVHRFAAKHPDKLRASWLRWWASEHSYRVRSFALVVVVVVSIMWTAYDKWANEVARANTAEQALELRTRQQFPRFPIGHSSSANARRLESPEWMTLGTPAVPFDWSTVPPDADVFATLRVRMFGGRRSRNCRAARVRVRDLGTDTIAGATESIPYIPDTDQAEVVRIQLDRRTVLAHYALEVASETADCPVNVQGEIGAEYRKLTNYRRRRVPSLATLAGRSPSTSLRRRTPQYGDPLTPAGAARLQCATFQVATPSSRRRVGAIRMRRIRNPVLHLRLRVSTDIRIGHVFRS